MVRIGSLALLGSAMVGLTSAASGGSKEEYASGEVHARIMAIKMAQWEAEEQAGLMDSSQYPELGYTPCVDGFAAAIPGDANNTFRCSNVDLYHFLSHADLGSVGRGSSSWGWTSEDGREIVAIGQYDGTAFAEISEEGKLVYLGRLPQFDPIGSNWREIRIVGDICVIGSEAMNHGVQLFDMKKVLDLDPASPKTFTQSEGLAGHWGLRTNASDEQFWNYLPVGRTHNIVVNFELNYAVAVGSVGGNETVRVRSDMPCKGGLIFLDISDPENVHSTGCAAGDGYVHDAECVVYRGPDERYHERDICYAYNEDTLTIYDVTDKTGNVTNIISIIDYPGVAYSHQGVVNDRQWQEYIFLDDEFDETAAPNGEYPDSIAQGRPTTHIIDIRNLEKPVWTGSFAGTRRSIDHNQYIVDNLVYQSNYGNGLNVWDISSVTEDPTGGSVCEAGFFDVYPEDDEEVGGGLAAFLGSWSSFAEFKSGFIFVHTIERGSFVVKMTSKECPKPPKCNADNCLRALRASHIEGRLEESIEFCGNFTNRLNDEESLLPEYARQGCYENQNGGPVERVSSACECIPTTTVPELPKSTRGPPVTVLP